MSSHAIVPDNASGNEHVHGGPKIYAAVLVGLLVLTCITVGASYINFGSTTVNVVVSMTIATLKASLVALFFMHLRWDKPMNAVIFVSSLFFLGTLLLFVFIDQDSRPDISPASHKPPAGGRPVAATAPAGTKAGHVPVAAPAAVPAAAPAGHAPAAH